MKCIFCEYDWKPRVEAPKACPRCKARFDYPKVFEEKVEMNVY
ncbi:MAG: hypothetical protein U9O94_04620 [Nanoarchaeota archaeon]|nr:hypothetical protein [Nanoarchaeota archaeon]